jgi:hypothetical protein
MYMYDPAKTNAAMVVVNLLELPEALEALSKIGSHRQILLLLELFSPESG